MPNLSSIYANSGFARAFRHRNFSIYIVAHSLSVVGLWIQRIAIQWLVWTLTDSYAWLGAIALIEAGASMLFSLAAGPLVDRFDRVKLALLTQGLLMLLAFVLAFCIFVGFIDIPLLIGFVLLVGLLEGVWAPVRLALMPNMVPKADMPAAISITSTMFTLATFVGPAVGALIVSWLGIKGAFIANAISYLGLLIVFALLKIPRQALRSNQPGILQDYIVGFTFLARHRALRVIVLFAVAFSLLIRPYRELFAGVADDIFQRGPEGLAALASASGLGALIGAIGISVYGRNDGVGKIVYFLASVCVLGLLVFANSNSFALSLITVGCLACCVTVIGTGSQMLIQMTVDDNMRGRVMSVWHAQFRGVPAIGAWLLGIVEPFFGLSWVLSGAACLFFLFLLSTLTWRREFQILEETAIR